MEAGEIVAISIVSIFIGGVILLLLSEFVGFPKILNTSAKNFPKLRAIFSKKKPQYYDDEVGGCRKYSGNYEHFIISGNSLDNYGAKNKCRVLVSKCINLYRYSDNKYHPIIVLKSRFHLLTSPYRAVRFIAYVYDLNYVNLDEIYKLNSNILSRVNKQYFIDECTRVLRSTSSGLINFNNEYILSMCWDNDKPKFFVNKSDRLYGEIIHVITDRDGDNRISK